MNTLFPVYIYEEGLELPTEGTYYLVSGNGLWLHKDTGIVRGFVPVDNISVLEELKADAKIGMNMPKLPAKYVYKIKKFFQEVVRIHHAESATILYYNKHSGEFKVQVTEQSVSHGGVHYKRIGLSHTEEMANFLRVGTIHSHCDFNAFHSGTDIGDEEHFDGLHCTFGHNDREEFSITASIVMNGHRLKVDPTTVLEGITPVNDVTLGEKKSWWGGAKDDFFVLDRPDEQLVFEWEGQKEQWLSHVRGSYSRAGFLRRPMPADGIVEGVKVNWAGDLKMVQIRSVMGEGPFEVLGREDDRIIIETKAGRASLSVKLFNKEIENEENTQN